MNMFTSKTFCVSVSLMCFVISNCRADYILNYDGLTFTNTQGTGFELTDSISGQFVFDAIGAAKAKSIRLVATLGGQPNIVFDIFDVSSPIVITNSFSAWSNGIPSEWDVIVAGNVFGGSEEEQISTTFLGLGNFLNGDQAVLDFGRASAATGFAPPLATWSAVPEPSSLLSVCVAVATGIFYRRRRSKTHLLASLS